MQRSPITFVFFFLVVSVLAGLLHYYLYARLARATELGPALQRAFAVGLVALALLTPLGMASSRWLTRPASTVVAWATYSWMGLLLLLFISLTGTELLRVAYHAYASLTNAPVDPARRVLLSRGLAGAAGMLALSLAGTGAASALGRVAVKPVTVPLKRLPASLSGLRIVQISDLHIGPTLGRDWLEDVVARVNACEPDIIAITGDLVDGSVATLRADVAPLAKLSAKHGVFFVTGNHEYYSGADEWIAELGRLGVRVLRNERVSIGDDGASFDLAGVDDWSAARFGNGHGPDLARALAGRDPARELVLLAHQPKQIHDAAKQGVGLQLSGHTHGGQIFPWHFLVGLDQPYLAGLAKHDETHIYVSRGTGYWGPPIRVGAPSEISLIELVSVA